MHSAVSGIAPAFHQTGSLEVVDEGHHPARGHAELIGDRLLAAAGFNRDRSQEADMWRSEAERLNSCGVLGRRVRTEC
jgi:hypothetical protein